MSRPRLKKFVRAEVADPLRLQPRDIALLRDVAEFRFLNTEQIFALPPGGKRNLSRRLVSLFQHGYLDRPQNQTPPFPFPRPHYHAVRRTKRASISSRLFSPTKPSRNCPPFCGLPFSETAACKRISEYRGTIPIFSPKNRSLPFIPTRRAGSGIFSNFKNCTPGLAILKIKLTAAL